MQIITEQQIAEIFGSRNCIFLLFRMSLRAWKLKPGISRWFENHWDFRTLCMGLSLDLIQSLVRLA